MWKKIETFPLPKQEFDYDQPKIMLFSKETGVVIGRCLKIDSDPDLFKFQYERDGIELHPTHWTKIPEQPEKEIEQVTISSLKELLETPHREEILKICQTHSANLSWRRDRLRNYVRDHNIDLWFNMAELKELIKELE